MADTDQLTELAERYGSANDDELLTAIGTAALNWDERQAAALEAFAPKDLAEQLAADGLAPKVKPVDLAKRGREIVDRLVREKTSEIKAAVCQKYKTRPDGVDLVTDLVPVAGEGLGTLLGLDPGVGIVVAAAVYISRYSLAKICD